MMVSGTYWPPYAPNRPRTTGLERLLGALVITSDCLQERLDQPRIFAAAVVSGGWILNVATDIDAAQRHGLFYLGQRRIDEDADGRPNRLGRFLPKNPDDPGGLGGWNKTFARLPEDEAEPIRASLNGGAPFGQRAQAAHFDQGHTEVPDKGTAMPASTSKRNFAPGSGERRSDSPIRIASTPAASSALTCSGAEMPLS